MKNLIKKIKDTPVSVKAAFWFMVCSLLQKGVSIITTPIFTRIMPVEDYGTYTVYTSWQGILTIFATLNLSYYVFNKGMVKYEDDKENFILSLQMLGSVSCIILFAVYILGHKYFNSILGLTTNMMILMFVYFFFEPSTLYWTSRQRFDYKYKSLVIVTALITILNPVIGVIFVLIAKDKALAMIFSMTLVGAGFGACFYILHIKRSNKKNITKYWKYALNFNIPLIPHFLTSIVLSNADRLMIGSMCGKSYAGVYGVAYSASMIMILFNNAIHQALLPWLYKKIKNKDFSGVRKVQIGLCLFVAVINFMLIALAPEALRILAPMEYYGARWIIPPVAASVYFMFVYNLFSNIEMYYEESKLITVTSIGLAILNIILNYIYINKYGYLAAGYTTLFCYIIYAVAHYFMMKFVCKKHCVDQKLIFDIKSILLLSVAFIVGCGVLLFMYDAFIMRISVFLGATIVLLIKRKTIVQKFIELRGE